MTQTSLIVSVLFVLITTVVVDAALIEPRRVLETDVTVSLQDLPQSLRGIRIVQISDLHYRPDNTNVYETVLQMLSKTHPDVFVITGDLVSFAKDEERCVSYIQRLREVVKCPTIVVLGNTDHWTYPSDSRRSRFLELLRNTAGVTVLINTSIAFPGHPEARIVGIDDQYSFHGKIEESYAAVDPSMFCLLLTHAPENIAAIVRDHPLTGLVLCGHTHGGQIGLPFIGGVWAPTMDGNRYIAGAYSVGSENILYVNRGIGTSIVPLRFACPPEITVFTLEQ